MAQLQINRPAGGHALEQISPQRVQITLTGDALLVVGLAGWLIWDRLIRSRVVRHLDGVFAPLAEEKAIQVVLAQIGLITHASRVILCAYHNGAITPGGYGLTKLSTINSYCAPGHLPMATPIRDLPVGRVSIEIDQLLEAAKKGGAERWVLTEYSDDLPEPCRDHLKRNDIAWMWSTAILVGNLPIGILACQFSFNERRKTGFLEGPHAEVLAELYEQLAALMRRRVVHPGLIRRLWMRFARSNQAGSPR